VDILFLNPWAFARLRFDGWKVLFITVSPLRNQINVKCFKQQGVVNCFVENNAKGASMHAFCCIAILTAVSNSVLCRCFRTRFLPETILLIHRT
jgi:hypothetical protein